MNYDFDKIITRRGTNSVKWDESESPDIIPMWVADMDFQTAPCIIEALQRRIEHGIFGYTLVPNSYYDAIINWFSGHHQWQIDRSWILYTSGVVPALSAIIKALTQPKDKVLIQSPVYNCFFSSIKNNGCEAVESPLVYQKNTYYVDWNDFEAKLSDPLVKLFILCNPHNPAGRVWKREELLRMNELCMKHGVKVIADEIHCELVMPGHTFVPFASISEDTLNNSITCNSPSKSFNTAGLQIANIICNDKETRLRIDRAININEVCDVNPFGVIALQVAYNEGSDWLDALNAYLYDNYLALKTYFAANMPQLEVTRLEGTYLVWVNIKPLGISSDALTEKLLSEAKVKVNSGTMYGRQTGEGFIRLNIACPRSQMMEGLQRIKQVVTK